MALAVALTLAGARGQAEGELGRSVADARLLYETFGRYPSFRIPPGNVRAEDYWALFGNTVMVIDVTGAKGIAPGALKVVFIGKDGRYLWCNPAKEGRYSVLRAHLVAGQKKQGWRLWPIFATGIRENPGWFSPVYDAATGDAIWYSPWRGRWRAWNIGHHQARLPAATWTLCPEFPSAGELGMGVNQLQTAVTYDALLTQDPGRRILRPDLVTPDPIERAK